MSNGRQHRRGIASAKLREQLAAADAAAPTIFFGSGRGRGESITIPVGRSLFVLAVPPAGASDDLLRAFSARATASITGQCPECAAKRHIVGSTHDRRARFAHEADCPANDERITETIEAEGLAS